MYMYSVNTELAGVVHVCTMYICTTTQWTRRKTQVQVSVVQNVNTYACICKINTHLTFIMSSHTYILYMDTTDGINEYKQIANIFQFVFCYSRLPVFYHVMHSTTIYICTCMCEMGLLLPSINLTCSVLQHYIVYMYTEMKKF